jgi:hypothetical protein
VTQREVRAGTSHDGTAFLSGSDLPVDRAAAADDYLTRPARAPKAEGDPRTLQQLRADAFLDLLTGLAFRVRPSRDPVTAAADHAEVEGANQPREITAASTMDGPRKPPISDPLPAPVDGVTAALGRPMAASESTVDQRDPLEAERLIPAWAIDDIDAMLGLAGFDTTAATPDGHVGDSAENPPLDARVSCLCGGVRPADRRGVVSVTVSLPTLMGLSDEPASSRAGDPSWPRSLARSRWIARTRPAGSSA